MYYFGDGDEFGIGFMQVYVVGFQQQDYVCGLFGYGVFEQFYQFGIVYFVYGFVYEFVFLCGGYYGVFIQQVFVDDDVIIEGDWCIELV